jgi:transposase
MCKAVLGIDISKATFDVVLLHREQERHAQFDNDVKGFAALSEWLARHDAEQVHACLEATGRYGDELALYLYQAGHTVSIENPARIKKYAESQLVRNKTDKADAAIIADFCRTQPVHVWEPPEPAYQELQALVRHLQALKAMQQQEKNRLAAGIPSKTVRATIEQHIAFLEGQIAALTKQIDNFIDQNPLLRKQKDLLVSIPGIGDTTAARLLAEIQDVNRFESASQLAAYTGLTPSRRESGSSVRGRASLSKKGRASFRKMLYFPAINARSHNPIVQPFCQRLEERGKCGMVIICAAMRKLVHIIYGVLKHQQPFDPNYLAQAPTAA